MRGGFQDTVSKTIEPEGRITYFDYVSANETRTALLGRGTTYYIYQRDSGADFVVTMLKKVDALGGMMEWGYDATLNRVTRAVDPNGNVTYYAYQGGTAPNMYAPTQSLFPTFPNLAVTVYRYGGGAGGAGALLNYMPSAIVGRMNTPSTPVVSYYEYNASFLQTSSMDPLKNVTSFGVDTLGRRIATKDARGNTTYYNYGSATGHFESQVNPDGSVAYYAYNSFRDVVRMVSPRWTEQSVAALTTYFEVDSLGRRTKMIEPLNGVTYYAWTSRGDLMATVDPQATDTEYTYNGLRLLTRETTTDSSGVVMKDLRHGYDIYRNKIQTKDTRGNSTYFFFDQLDRAVARKDALQNAAYFFYDKVGNQTATRDALGNMAYYFYNSLSLVTASLDALRNPSYYFYDLANNRTHVRNARGNAAYYFYDELDRTKSQRNALGNVVYFGYDSVGNLSAVLDPRANGTYYFYDTRDRQKAVRDPQGALTYFFYDAAGNRTRVIDARLNATYFFYDVLDRLQVGRDALGNPTYYFYDSVGDGTALRDARGGLTYFVFDGMQRMTLAQDSVGAYTAWTYDGNDNVVEVQQGFYSQRPGYGLQPYGTTPYGGSAIVDQKFFYDAVDRLQSVLDSLGNPTYFFYDAVGNRTHIRNARGNTVYYFYDAVNRPTIVRDPLGKAAYFFYDANSNRIAVRNPNLHGTYFGYDSLDRMSRIQDALGGTTYFDFDAVGNLVKVFDPDLHTVQARYDSLDRPDAIRMPDAGSAYFFYDLTSNRIKEVDPRGNATYYRYDAVNRVTGLQDALFRTLYFDYDQVGNLSRYMDAEGATSAYTYDLANRRTNTLYTAAGSVVPASLRSDPYYVYDLRGDITQMGDLWGLHQLAYDLDGRLTAHQYPNGSKVYFEYDAVSNLITRVYPGTAGKAGAGYDELSRQIRIQTPSGATAYFAYDAGSHLTQRFLGNSTKVDVSYDAAERIRTWRASNKNSVPLTYFDYTRDAKGLITKAVREANYTVYFSYDGNDRLLSEIWAKTGTTPSEVYGYRYAYDLAGNRTKAKVNAVNTYYFYDQANQLTVTGSTSAWATPSYYIYDKNGSLSNLVETAGATYFAYNAVGLVARIRWRDASATYFLYDGKLQRYGMVAAGATAATYFLWDGPNLLQELNADGTVKEEHTNARMPIVGIGQLVESNRPGQAQVKLYPIMDPRGSITKWMQSDGSTVFASREYDAFGLIIPNSAIGTWPGRQGYQGNSWIEIFSANALQRLNLSPTRIQDPFTGRFLQDEILLQNRPHVHYIFCGQNPIAYVDPTGLQGWDPNQMRRRAQEAGNTTSSEGNATIPSSQLDPRSGFPFLFPPTPGTPPFGSIPVDLKAEALNELRRMIDQGITDPDALFNGLLKDVVAKKGGLDNWNDCKQTMNKLFKAWGSLFGKVYDNLEDADKRRWGAVKRNSQFGNQNWDLFQHFAGGADWYSTLGVNSVAPWGGEILDVIKMTAVSIAGKRKRHHVGFDWDDLEWGNMGGSFAKRFDIDDCSCKDLVKTFLGGRRRMSDSFPKLPKARKYYVP